MAENTNIKDPIYWETFGWTERTISRGAVYFHNKKTNETSLERPQKFYDEDTEKAGDWIQQKAQTEMVYYYNTNTKVFSWEIPKDLRQQRAKQQQQFRQRSTICEELVWKKYLIQQLKEGYKQLFDTILPIPFIQDRVYCVNNIFVESVVELNTARWSPLSSYHDVLSDTWVSGRERILTGEPGLGKSTLTMQYAYEWCTKAKGSFMKDVEILILLRVRQLDGVRSIYEAIRRFLIPQKCLLTKRKVELAIRRSTSVVVILDGLDEFAGEEGSSAAIITALMTGMLEEVKVLVTSRNVTSTCSSETKRFRLTGFDERAQETYIRKAVVGHDEVAAGRIMKLLKESPILVDLCKIPLFFAMFAHMTHEDENLKPFRTVTSFFKCLIKCLYSHMRNKMDNTNMKISLTFQENHKELDKVAFECLSGRKIIWKKGEIRERLGESLYNEYLTLGILIEEEVPNLAREEGQPSYNENETEVRFYHQHFCDWYGAHFIQSCASTFDDKHLKETLGYLTPLRHQYCYRFACGLNRQCAERVITHLKDNNEQSDMFAKLCTIEQLDEDEDVLRNTRDLFSRGVAFNQNDNKLKIKSTIQLLEIASSHKIPIKMVSLINCYWRVEMSGNVLQLSHNFRLPVLPTLRILFIQLTGRLKREDAKWETLILYASKCLTLESVEIYNCQMPPSRHPHFSASLPFDSTLRIHKAKYHSNGSADMLFLRPGLGKDKQFWIRYRHQEHKQSRISRHREQRHKQSRISRYRHPEIKEPCRKTEDNEIWKQIESGHC